MLIEVNAAKCIGIDAVPVVIQVDVSPGIGIHLVGLADAAVKESLLRTITALQASGFHIPGKKIVINLAPADIHKSGSGYDLPIAIGILAASGQRELPYLRDFVLMGELGLDASIREIPGALPLVDYARSQGFRGMILPGASALETVDYDGIDVYGVETLEEVIAILENPSAQAGLRIRERWQQIATQRGTEGESGEAEVDFADIIGQEQAKRGLEIAAAGGHNVLLLGPPGSGKSSLAKAFPGILPPFSREEAVLSSKIWSVAGKKASHCGLMRQRPFRAPHGSASLPAFIGGGSGDNILPGEVSLAQGGVLFLDEFCEAPKKLLEALRGPMEDRRIVISRLKAKVEYPASFMLIAASNPCPCGYYGEADRCSCTPGQRAGYLAKLSGPIMDRIDIQLWMHPVQTGALIERQKAEPSEAIARRVARAREQQARRFEGEGIFCNAEMSGAQIDRYCPLSPACKQILEKLISQLGLSARAFSRMIKIARTIADLDGTDEMLPQQLSEAASYRFLDRRNLF